MMQIRKKHMLLLFLCAGLLSGCGNSQQEKMEKELESSVEDTGIVFTDDLGYVVNLDTPLRTAVLSGSYAESWLLAGGELAAVTEDAKEVIEVTEAIVDLGEVKHPSVETMLAADIDFVILSSAIATHVELRDTLETAGIATAYFEVETFADYKEMMQIFTAITGREDLYEENVAQVEQRINEQIARAESALANESNPTVLFLRAFSTGVKAKGSDSMTGQMLKDLGCVNIADSDDSLLEDISMEAIIAADPDYIFVTTMGASEEAGLAMVDELLANNPAWSGLSAIENGHYVVLPQDLFHNKPNNRWDESYRILADEIYGEE